MFKLFVGQQYGRQMYKLAEELFDLLYPQYEWRKAWCAFDSSDNNSQEMKTLEWIEQIASKEKLCPTKTRTQFKAMFPVADKLWQEHRNLNTVWCQATELCRDCSTLFEFSWTYRGHS